MQASMEKTPGRADTQLSAGYGAVREQVESTIRTVKDEVNTAARVAAEQAQAAAGQALDHGKTLVRDARMAVRTSPEKWMLIAMGAGVVLGVCTQMMASRRNANGNQRSH